MLVDNPVTITHQELRILGMTIKARGASSRKNVFGYNDLFDRRIAA